MVEQKMDPRERDRASLALQEVMHKGNIDTWLEGMAGETSEVLTNTFNQVGVAMFNTKLLCLLLTLHNE